MYILIVLTTSSVLSLPPYFFGPFANKESCQSELTKFNVSEKPLHFDYIAKCIKGD